MPSRTKYLFDSDVLITSARIHYSPSFCQIFWDWIQAGHQAGVFFSIDKVRDELLDGNEDPLKEWASSSAMEDFFRPSLPSIGKWRALASSATDPSRAYKDSAKNKFLDAEKADAWLIAYAANNSGFVVVTNEVSRPESKKEIKLPDAASWLGVSTVKLFEVIKKFSGGNFSFNDGLSAKGNVFPSGLGIRPPAS